MAAGIVTLRCNGRVAYLLLDRRRLRNRLDNVMAQRLWELGRQLDQEPAIGVVVLTGRGRSFSCGVELPAGDESLPKGAGALAALEKPSIAAINGDAIDQGLELALACDLRIAVEGARLGLTHLKRGLIPWDGGTQRLPRIVGRAWATDLLLTGRLIDAEEALRIGMVHQVVGNTKALQHAVEDWANNILEAGPIALAYAKEAVVKGMEMTLEQGLRLEADLAILLHSTHDRAEGIRSFLERRRPAYRGQ